MTDCQMCSAKNCKAYLDYSQEHVKEKFKHSFIWIHRQYNKLWYYISCNSQSMARVVLDKGLSQVLTNATVSSHRPSTQNIKIQSHVFDWFGCWLSVAYCPFEGTQVTCIRDKWETWEMVSILDCHWSDQLSSLENISWYLVGSHTSVIAGWLLSYLYTHTFWYSCDLIICNRTIHPFQYCTKSFVLDFSCRHLITTFLQEWEQLLI